jgi:hypothetical protein
MLRIPNDESIPSDHIPEGNVIEKHSARSGEEAKFDIHIEQSSSKHRALFEQAPRIDLVVEPFPHLYSSDASTCLEDTNKSHGVQTVAFALHFLKASQSGTSLALSDIP